MKKNVMLFILIWLLSFCQSFLVICGYPDHIHLYVCSQHARVLRTTCVLLGVSASGLVVARDISWLLILTLLFIVTEEMALLAVEVFRTHLEVIILIFTARVRSTREGTVFTGVCLLTFWGGGVPRPGLDCWGRVPHLRSGGRVPQPGLDGGTPSQGATLARS